jgi:hypothetical protein
MAQVLNLIRFVVLPLAAVGAALVIASAEPRPSTDSFDPRCDDWDRAAAAAVAALIAERRAVADRRLGDAVFRLQRARKNCRYDLVGLARLDYRALTDGRYLKPR